MDVKTLFVCNIVLPFFVGLILLFFRSQQKTYPGFGFWILGSFVISAGYFALYLRVFGWEIASILLNNGLFSLAALLRLEGTVRFLRDQRLPRGAYFLPLGVMGLMALLIWGEQGLAVRVFFISLVVTLIGFLMVWELFKHAPRSSRRLYHATGWLYLCFGVFLMARAVQMLVAPDGDILQAQIIPMAYFFATMLFEVAWMLSFVMMNSQRLEDELVQSFNRFKSASAELKTLSGLLPICASCKKVRDDKGYWRQIEQYISQHSSAEFSHGLCPECAEKLYPDLLWSGSDSSQQDANPLDASAEEGESRLKH